MNSSVLSGYVLGRSQASHCVSSTTLTSQPDSRMTVPPAQRPARLTHRQSTRSAATSNNGAQSSAESEPVHPSHKSPSRGRRRNRDDALPLSLFSPYDHTALPCDGRTQHVEDETCDPNERTCKTTMHVWESNCRMCCGTGNVSYYSRGGRGRGGRRSSGVCPGCHGVGCVRKTSSRIVPNVDGGNGQYTAARPPCEITWSEGDKQQSLFDRFKEKLEGGKG